METISTASLFAACPNVAPAGEQPKIIALAQNSPRGIVILAFDSWDKSERYKGAEQLICPIELLRLHSPDLLLVAVGQGGSFSP